MDEVELRVELRKTPARVPVVSRDEVGLHAEEEPERMPPKGRLAFKTSEPSLGHSPPEDAREGAAVGGRRSSARWRRGATGFPDP